MLRQIVLIEPVKRTQHDIKIALQELKKLEYFINFAKKKGSKLLHNVLDGFAKYSQLEHYEQGHLLLKAGDKSDKFLILLEGEVVFLKLKTAEVLQEEKRRLMHQYPEIDMSHNFIFLLISEDDKLVLKQVTEKIESKLHSFTRIMQNPPSRSVKRQKSQPDIIIDTKSAKYFHLPINYMKSLSEEVDLCLSGYQIDSIHCQIELILQSLFDGPIFKYKIEDKHKESQHGECLTPELNRLDHPRKKIQSSAIALTKCEILSITIQQFDELMRSIDKARVIKNVKILVNAFDEGFKSTDLQILMKELVNHTTPIKLCAQQVLYQQGQPCQTLYAVLRGDFVITKEFNYDKEYLPNMILTKGTQNPDLYNLFQNSLQSDRKAQQITTLEKQTSRLRSNTLEEHVRVDIHSRDKTLLSQVGNSNYQLIQLIYQMRRKEGKIQDDRKFKQNIKMQYNLAKAGYLIGEESFSHEIGGGAHHYSCRCVSHDAKIIAIKRNDIYKLCRAFDWFARMFVDRSQKKSEWLLQRFQDRLAMDLETFYKDLDPAHLHSQQKAEQQEKKDADQIILDKFQQVVRQTQDHSDISTLVLDKKMNIQKKKFQNNTLEMQLNVISINAGQDTKKYHKQFQQDLDKKGVNSQSQIKMSPQIDQTQPFLRGTSPCKGLNDFSMDQLTKNSNDQSRSMKHLAAKVIIKTLEQTVNMNLNNPIQVYKSQLLNESCIVYQDKQQTAVLPNQSGNDKNIGIIEYLVSCDKNQLRLQQYIMNKNNRFKHSKSQAQVNGMLNIKSPTPAPDTLNSFSTLLQKVTLQHYNKLLIKHKEQIQSEEQPLLVRQLLSQRCTQVEREISTQTDLTNFQYTRASSISPQKISTNRFPAGVYNQSKIRQLYKRSRIQSTYISKENSILDIRKMSDHKSYKKVIVVLDSDKKNA